MPKGNAVSDAMEVPFVELPESHPCNDCGVCCDYVAVEIDPPTSFKDYENIHWYLVHRDITVYIDWEGDWFIEFMSPCENQTEAKTCGIYEVRPEMCSGFSWEECEHTVKEPAHRYRFNTPEEFFSWMEETRPAAYKRWVKSRKKLLEKRQQRREGDEQPEESGKLAPGRATQPTV